MRCFIAPQDAIAMRDAAPALVEPALFDRVQVILDDPHCLRGGRRTQAYARSARAKCLLCGRVLVGPVLNRRYRYSRCSRTHAGPAHDRCPGRHFRADTLEQRVRGTMAEVLAQPERIVAEHQRARAVDGHADRRAAHVPCGVEGVVAALARL